MFQLCWSANAKQSQYVTDEWRFALGLQRPNFIRPCCWEDPIPEPPPELQRLHFARLKLSRLMRTRLFVFVADSANVYQTSDRRRKA